MMRPIQKKLAATAISACMVFSPTVAAASTFSAPATAQPQNAWVTLSQMTQAGATALASSGAVSAAPDAAALAAAAAAAQPADETANRPNPLPLPVIAVLLGVLGMAAYIALIEKHDHGHVTTPSVSPA
jgi:hypothetical protein